MDSRRRSIAMRPLRAALRVARRDRQARATTPLDFATCVAMRSMMGGDRQSLAQADLLQPGSDRTHVHRIGPDSMIDDTKAANSPAPAGSDDNSVWKKSKP